jgi:DNA-binding NarL/FixJ family response regulator
LAGGTLVISRAILLFPFFRQYLEGCGFRDVETAEVEKDGLVFKINETRPRLMFIESGFYGQSTPFMAGKLVKKFPKLRIAAFSLGEFPDTLAMWFIFHGVKSYLNFRDGIEEFGKGLRVIQRGDDYCSPRVLERIDLLKEIPPARQNITDQHQEVLNLLWDGYKTEEIADTLHISDRTVETHKSDMYKALNVRNERELLRVALYLGLIKDSAPCFWGRKWAAPPLPLPEKTRKKRIKTVGVIRR